MFGKGKGKPLTIAMLGLSPKGKGGDSEEEPEVSDEEDTEEGDDSELPMGLLEAVTEMREASDDESAARAFYNAMKCCE